MEDDHAVPTASTAARSTRRTRSWAVLCRSLSITRPLSAPIAHFSRLKSDEDRESTPITSLANVHCSCGNQFYTRSTKADLHVELCSECHPFYTGKQKLVDTGGRVERFQRRAAKHAKAGK